MKALPAMVVSLISALAVFSCVSQQTNFQTALPNERGEMFNVVRKSHYRVLWKAFQKKAQSDYFVTILFEVKDSLGRSIANADQGRLYLLPTLLSRSDEPVYPQLWFSKWNPTLRQYEVAGKLGQGGRWRLDVDFYAPDAVNLQCQLPLWVKNTGDTIPQERLARSELQE